MPRHGNRNRNRNSNRSKTTAQRPTAQTIPATDLLSSYGGQTSLFTSPPDKSVLEVLVEAGLDPLYDCARGECGTCQVRVLEGVPDHHDTYLSDAQKKAGNVMQICVSRSHTDKLVLDI